MYIAAVAVFNY